MKFNFISFAD